SQCPTIPSSAWRPTSTPQACSGLESGVLYWHMVDLVWVLLFPLVYVLQ
ncbi:cytochrome c oxidase subunit 3, partial [Pseudomonas aeruginosa]